MKLIFCKECCSVISLSLEEKRCDCGKSGGKYYPDGVDATFFGPAIPLGFNNVGFKFALNNQPFRGIGRNFEAFVVPENCKSFKKV